MFSSIAGFSFTVVFVFCTVVNTSYSLVKFIPKVKDAATFLIQQVGSMSKGKDDEKAEPVIIDSENIPEEDDLKLDSDPSEKSEVLVDA